MSAVPRTAVIICLLAIWSLLLVIAFWLVRLSLAIAGSTVRMETKARWLINIYGRGCMLIVSPWIKVEKINLQALSAPCIVVANHLSMLDLTCLTLLPNKNLCLLVKSWPARLPGMGSFVRAGNYIEVDSLPFASILARAQGEMAKDSIIVVFPEGRRSADGRLGRLRSGAFKLALATGLPLMPLRFSGSNRALPKGTFNFYPAKISMRLFDAIKPETVDNNDGRAHKKLSCQIKNCLQATI